MDALAKVPFIAVMATHEGPELDRAHVVLPAALWAEVDGHLHELRSAGCSASGGRCPRPATRRRCWELAAGLLERLGQPLGATSAREVFAAR